MADPNVPTPPKVSKTRLKKPDRQSKAGSTAKAIGRINPGYTPPAQMPFESTLSFAFRSCGGKPTAINGARLVEDPRFARVVWAYDQATERDKEKMDLEELCKAADIPSDEFLGAVLSALWKRSIDIGKLTAIVAHPRIVEATIEAAQGKFGMPDRKMLLDHAGFLPQPKGQTINVGVDARTAVSTTIEVGKGLPSFEDEGKKLNSAMRTEMKALESAPESITITQKSKEVIEAEFTDVPRD